MAYIFIHKNISNLLCDPSFPDTAFKSLRSFQEEDPIEAPLKDTPTGGMAAQFLHLVHRNRMRSNDMRVQDLTRKQINEQ